VLYTRESAPGSQRAPGRLTLDDLTRHGHDDDTTVYVCGSAGFAAAATDLVMQAGFDTRQIRVERFGPTG